MPLTIVSYQPEHVDAVARFNERGKANGAPFQLNATPEAMWLPKRTGGTLFREFFLALDAGEVRGGFTLRRQKFSVGGTIREVANYQGPLSEGLWDRRFMMAGVQMLRAALRENPLLYALGMGGMEQPLPKLLQSAGWALAPVPFLFKVLRPARFLLEIRPLRRTRARAWALDLAALSGVGSLAIHARQRWNMRRSLPADCAAMPTQEYGDWADLIWDHARDGYLLSAQRDRESQNVLFGDGSERNIILRCTRSGCDIGWAVVRSTPMNDDKYFGRLRVGSLVDAMAVPGEQFTVVELATRYLGTLGSDLVVTNQTHHTWIAALRDDGYFDGPTNFIFACSPALVAEVGSLDESLRRFHFNRADGDGPIHL